MPSLPINPGSATEHTHNQSPQSTIITTTYEFQSTPNSQPWQLQQSHLQNQLAPSHLNPRPSITTPNQTRELAAPNTKPKSKAHSSACPVTPCHHKPATTKFTTKSDHCEFHQATMASINAPPHLSTAATHGCFAIPRPVPITQAVTAARNEGKNRARRRRWRELKERLGPPMESPPQYFNSRARRRPSHTSAAPLLPVHHSKTTPLHRDASSQP